jgi:tRNA pseudouridine65 synthase
LETQEPLEILYEDKWIIAINKPAGLLVHRSSIATNTDVYALQLLRDQVGHHVYPIHRLDRKTSGVLLFAKDKSFVQKIQASLSSEISTKTYYAIVRGYFPNEINVDYDLTNDKGKTQNAITDFKLISTTEIDLPFGKFNTSRYSLIKAQPRTGRMHQIRKHLNHLRHPIIGDRPHGCNKQNKLFLEKWSLTKMLLHAIKIEIEHPYLGQEITISSPLPQHFNQTIENLKLTVD